MEYIKTVIEMFKKGKTTKYILEKELGNFLGLNIFVRLSEDCKNNNQSFILFAIPEYKTEGFVLTYVLDKNALMNLLSTDELVDILDALKRKTQKIYKMFFTSVVENTNRDISRNNELGFLLNLYTQYSDVFEVSGKNITPDIDEILKLADVFNTEKGTDEDIENAIVKGILCQDIIEFAERCVRVGKDEVIIKLTDYHSEIPTFNLGYQELYDNCTSTFGVRDHKEIPYNYLPSTNQ